MTDKKDTRFKPGQSGNPNGRTPGHGEVAKLRQSISTHIPAIINKVVEAAMGGDLQAARLVLERVIPAVKPVDVVQALELPEGGSLTDHGRAVLTAVSDGRISPASGAQLVTAIGTLAKITEIDELAARISRLEALNAKTR